MPVEQRARLLAANDVRRTVGVARDRERRGLDQTARKLAWKQFHARLFRGVTRRKARCTPRAVPGIGELLRGKEFDEIVGRCFIEHPLDARDLDRVDAAASRYGVRRCARRA